MKKWWPSHCVHLIAMTAIRISPTVAPSRHRLFMSDDGAFPPQPFFKTGFVAKIPRYHLTGYFGSALMFRPGCIAKRAEFKRSFHSLKPSGVSLIYHTSDSYTCRHACASTEIYIRNRDISTLVCPWYLIAFLIIYIFTGSKAPTPFFPLELWVGGSHEKSQNHHNKLYIIIKYKLYTRHFLLVFIIRHFFRSTFLGSSIGKYTGGGWKLHHVW